MPWRASTKVPAGPAPIARRQGSTLQRATEGSEGSGGASSSLPSRPEDARGGAGSDYQTAGDTADRCIRQERHSVDERHRCDPESQHDVRPPKPPQTRCKRELGNREAEDGPAEKGAVEPEGIVQGKVEHVWGGHEPGPDHNADGCQNVPECRPLRCCRHSIHSFHACVRGPCQDTIAELFLLTSPTLTTVSKTVGESRKLSSAASDSSKPNQLSGLRTSLREYRLAGASEALENKARSAGRSCCGDGAG